MLENFKSLKLNHGSMEMGYVSHQDLTLCSGLADHGKNLSISMTASTDIAGNLVLGKILCFFSQFSRTTTLFFFNFMYKDKFIVSICYLISRAMMLFLLLISCNWLHIIRWLEGLII